MKKSRHIIIGVMAAVFLAVGIQALAIQPIPKESGFNGFIQPGVGYLNIKSNMVAQFSGFDLSDKKINSLSDEPNSESTAIVTLPFEIAYTFASTRTHLFLGSSLIDLLRFDFSQQLGVRQEIGSLGVLQGGILFSGIPAKVWKDPFVVGRNRKDTTRDSTGARLTWDKILGSAFQAQYTYRKIDISSEKSGEFLGLDSRDRRRLKRDGDTHTGSVLYRFKLGQEHFLIPEFTLGYDNRDGDANTNTNVGGQLTYSYLADPVSLILNGFYSYADYDKKNPIYNKTQEDDTYGVGATVIYKNPWNWSLLGSKPMHFFATGAYYYDDSNIDFYKQEVVLGTVGVIFRW
ncbi:MAG: DUF2860 family protein [Desulfobacterales bacterium]